MNHASPVQPCPTPDRSALANHCRAFAPGVALLALGVGLLGCSESPSLDKTSTFQGALAVDSFPQRPESVHATNELGGLLKVPVSSTGDFRIELSRGHHYTLAVGSGTDRVNVVFPRATGQLTSQFKVSSGAALVSLGTVRYFAAAPPGGFFLKSAHETSGNLASSTAEQADGELGECVNGMILGTGAICVDDDGDVACEGDRSDGDGECENGKDTSTGLACVDSPEASDGDGECENGKDTSTGLACTDPADGSDGDGECEDGKDSTTGLACVDPADASDGDGECEDGVDSATGLPCTDPEDVVDPNRPMAVAEHNVPNQVGGCDEGGEEEGDD